MGMASNRIHVDVGFQAVLSRKINRIGALLELNPVSLELFTADVPEGFASERALSRQRVAKPFPRVPR